jgi:hypothetical protein
MLKKILKNAEIFFGDEENFLEKCYLTGIGQTIL